MRVVMLGWEYPPHISGGLGTACEGLTTSLARLGTEIVFVVPRLFGGEQARHMVMLDSSLGTRITNGSVEKSTSARLKGIQKVAIPAMLSPYWNPDTFKNFVEYFRTRRDLIQQKLELAMLANRTQEVLDEMEYEELHTERYGHDIFEEVSRYAASAVALLANEQFDVVHAHDWMTFPAGVALSQLSGKPLVAHVHSLEYDRSGTNVNHQIYEIERLGLSHAAAVVAVSYYTKAVVEQQHRIEAQKIHVVHNGVYPRQVVQSYRGTQRWPAKIVLFLGRITFQKGPDYFVEAAAKVIPHVPDVLFVMAGSGDMLSRMIRRVHELGIGEHFQFPGFLQGEEVEQIFSLADLYVMPSVSEPFGISALEAISFETPVIISRQSGVSEVLSHALKVDFWDLDKLSDLMINALLHEELRADMVSMARHEVKKLHWDAAALKTVEIYRNLC